MTAGSNLLLTRVTVQEYCNMTKKISIARPFLILANMESGPWEKMKLDKDKQRNPSLTKESRNFPHTKEILMSMVGYSRSKDE